MRWDDIGGNSVSIEAVYGPAVADAVDGDVFVELGVYKGRSLAMLLELAASKSLNVYGVDLWEDAAGIVRSAWPHAYEPATRLECVENLRACVGDAMDRVALIQRDTADAADDFADGSVTLAFIDGDHSYLGCKRDIAAWWPKIRSGGTLAGHDFSGEYPGVVQAVTEAFPEYVHHGARDTGICWLVRKP